MIDYEFVIMVRVCGESVFGLNYNNSLSLWNFDEYFLKCRVRTSAPIRTWAIAVLIGALLTVAVSATITAGGGKFNARAEAGARTPRGAKLLTRDEARRIAANIAKLPGWFAGTTEAPVCSFAGAFLNFGDMVGSPNTELRRSEH